MTNADVGANTGSAANVLHGPYWQLPPGEYSARFSFAPADEKATTEPLGSIDVVVGGTVVGSQEIHRLVDAPTQIVVPFSVPAGGEQPVETRVWTTGRAHFRVISVRVEARWRRASADAGVTASSHRLT
jgi:hypothetical protein